MPITIVILLLASLIMIIYFLFFYNPVNLKFYDNINNANNEYIKIQKMQNLLIYINSKPCDSYQITIRDSKILYEQTFDRYKYTRNAYKIKNLDFKQLDKICNDLEKLNNGIPLPLLIQGEQDERIKALIALGNILYEIKEKSKSLHIFVKGYADKTSGKWIRKLDKNYEYRNIAYYKATSQLKNTYYISEKNKTNYTIKENKYTNEDLPFLRSQFVLDNYKDNNLISCFPNITNTGILEGEEYPMYLPNSRNTEVYVTSCPD